MQGLFKININSLTLIEIELSNAEKRQPWEFPLITLGLVTPQITLPFYDRDQLGDWYRRFSLSFPTNVSIEHYDDISFSMRFELLGFGFFFLYQYGY